MSWLVKISRRRVFLLEAEDAAFLHITWSAVCGVSRRQSSGCTSCSTSAAFARSFACLEAWSYCAQFGGLFAPLRVLALDLAKLVGPLALLLRLVVQGSGVVQAGLLADADVRHAVVGGGFVDDAMRGLVLERGEGLLDGSFGYGGD